MVDSAAHGVANGFDSGYDGVASRPIFERMIGPVLNRQIDWKGTRP
jgi:hypothetical protein